MRMRRVKWAADYLQESKCRIFQPEQMKGKWKERLDRDKLHVEIGTGKGNYSLGMAALYEDDGFVAIEKNESAAGMAAKKYDEMGRDNLLLIYDDASRIEDWFDEGEVDIIHLNFSDPWPKKRNAKRRLSSPAFLKQYGRILAADGEIQMKTDNAALFEYSLLEMLKGGFTLEDVSVDFRSKEHPEDVITEYEEKFIAEKKPIYRSVWKKKHETA